MIVRVKQFLFSSLLLLASSPALWPGSAQAQEQAQEEPVAETSQPAAQPTPKAPKPRTGIPVQKDAEGSIAPNRFQADTVLKSHYSLDGKALEVDPD